MKFDSSSIYAQRDDELSWRRDLSPQARWRARQSLAGMCRYCTRLVGDGGAILCAQHMVQQRAAARTSYAKRRTTLRAQRVERAAEQVAAQAQAMVAAGRMRAAAALIIGDAGHAEAAARQAARRLRALRALGRRDPAALVAKVVG
jgi:hypothetical protein